MRSKRTLKIPALLLFSTAFLCLLPPAAWPQDFEQAKRIAEEKRKKLEAAESKVLAEEGRLLVEWGGWVDMRYDRYDNEIDNLDRFGKEYLALQSIERSKARGAGQAGA